MERIATRPVLVPGEWAEIGTAPVRAVALGGAQWKTKYSIPSVMRLTLT